MNKQLITFLAVLMAVYGKKMHHVHARCIYCLTFFNIWHTLVPKLYAVFMFKATNNANNEKTSGLLMKLQQEHPADFVPSNHKTVNATANVRANRMDQCGFNFCPWDFPTCCFGEWCCEPGWSCCRYVQDYCCRGTVCNEC
jgi:hypothetical protein